MSLKFFCYSFMRVRDVEEVVADIEMIINATRRFERKSSMMLFVFLPTPLIAMVAPRVDRAYVKLAAQDVSEPFAEEIAGELSLARLRQIGADMALAGSVDRRVVLQEDDRRIASKMASLLSSGLKSVLGVGEVVDAGSAEELCCVSEGAAADRLIENQIAAGFESVCEDAYLRMGVVYQPGWSIGSEGCSMPRDYVEARLEGIRRSLAKTVPNAPMDIPVFYGGRMDEDEAASYLSEGMFDGILVDDRQWDARSFCSVIERVCG